MTTKAAAFPARGHAVISTAPQTLFIRYFFVGMACLFPVIVLLGFGREFQEIGTGKIKPHWVVHVHGAVMSGWILVFLAQAILAMKGNFKFHRELGMFAAALGVLVWVAMGVTSLHMIIANHPPEGYWFFDLLVAIFYLMACFGLFFTWGILVRKKDPAAHKRLLLLATLVTLQSAVDRIHWLPTFGISYPFIYFMYLDLMLIPLFVYDSMTLRRIHRVTWFGSAFIIVAQLGVWSLWGSPVWHKFWYHLTLPYTEKVVEIKLGEPQTDPLLGKYGWEKWNLSVSREGGRLYFQFTGQDRQELGAISETVFFPRTDIGTYTFIKDANGTVAKVVAHAGAETQEMPRMKQP